MNDKATIQIAKNTAKKSKKKTGGYEKHSVCKVSLWRILYKLQTFIIGGGGRSQNSEAVVVRKTMIRKNDLKMVKIAINCCFSS